MYVIFALAESIQYLLFRNFQILGGSTAFENFVLIKISEFDHIFGTFFKILCISNDLIN